MDHLLSNIFQKKNISPSVARKSEGGLKTFFPNPFYKLELINQF